MSSEKAGPGNTPCTNGRIIVRLSRDSFFFRLPVRPHVETGPRAVCTDAVASPRRGAKGALSPRPGLQDEKARAHADSSCPPSLFKQQYRVLYIILLLLFLFQLCTTYTACNLLKGTHTHTHTYTFPTSPSRRSANKKNINVLYCDKPKHAARTLIGRIVLNRVCVYGESKL